MRLFGKQLWGGKKKEATIPFQTTTFSQLALHDNRTLSKTDLYSGWVFACVRAISEEVGRIELVLEKKQGNKITVLDSHPAIDLLRYVNDFLTQYNLFERLQANLELSGNEYWYVERKTKNGIPTKIYPLLPDAVRPVRGKYYVDYYQYVLNGKTYKFKTDEIVHFKTFNPFSDIIGLSTIEASRVILETDVISKEYNKRFFENDATPSGVLTHPDELEQTMADRIRDKWRENFGGYKRSFKTAILTGGLSYSPISVSHADIQFIEQSKLNRDDVLAMFRVPKNVIGILEEVNYASAKTGNYVFSLRTIFPKMHRIVDTLNEFYLPLFGEEGLRYTFKSPVQEDALENAQVNQIRFSNGQLSLNEWRKESGRTPVENGDQVFMPFNLVPYGKPVEQKSLESQPMLTKLSNDITKSVLAKLQVHQAQNCEYCNENKEHVAHQNEQSHETHAKRFQLRMDPQSFEDVGQKINGMMRVREEPFIKKMEGVMKQIFTDQRAEAISNLREYFKKSKKATKAKLPDFIDKARQVKITIDLVKPIIGDFFEKEGQSAYIKLGLDPTEFDLAAPNVRKYLENSIKKFANEVTSNTSAIIRQQIADGLESGEGVQAIASRIGDLAALSDTRAELIAITEIHRAQGHAELEAWAQSNVVIAKIWYTALDERVCEECSLMHGREVDLEEAFASVSDLREMGYQNYDGPAEIAQLHPRCRCSVIPVVRSDSAGNG